MSKKALVSIFLGLSLCLFSGCGKQKTIILFNKYPITKENLLNNATQFPVDKRIYYIFMTQKPLDTKMVRVKIYKRDEKANYHVTKLVLTVDSKLTKDQVYYYTDYIVMHDTGNYFMAVFAMNSMDKPLAVADFKVK